MKNDRNTSLAGMFSDNYVQARQRFLTAAHSCNADIHSLAILPRGAQGEDLAMDVAVLGSKSPERVILLTSGIHGVEGSLGSAIQASWLEGMQQGSVSLGSTAVVFVHALNPYGFSWQRRVNENNVDLNRNFLMPDQQFVGSPDQMKKESWLQVPVSPDNRSFILDLNMIRLVLFHGTTAIRNVLTKGQFDHPKALFWGGSKHEETTKALQDKIDQWVRRSSRVLHLDFHTGLGKYGQCKLLGVEDRDSKRSVWLRSKFGKSRVEHLGAGLVCGGRPQSPMGSWLTSHFEAQQKAYAYLAVEFGTYPGMRVFKALYEENRFHGHLEHPGYVAAKKELLEVFTPADIRWRDGCVKEGLSIIAKAFVVAEDVLWE